MSNTEEFARYYIAGTQLLHQGKAEKAIRPLEKAHSLDSSHVDAAINLSGAYVLRKKFKQAVALLEPFSKTDADHIMIWTNLGAAYLGNPVLANDDEQMKAIHAFKMALKINPIAPNAAYNIGLIYYRRNDPMNAAAYFQKAVQADPHDRDARSLLQRMKGKLGD